MSVIGLSLRLSLQDPRGMVSLPSSSAAVPEREQHRETAIRTAGDLPFYGGDPVAIEGRGWALLVLSVALAFAVLMAMPVEGFPATLVPPLLFAGVPLLALAALTDGHWTGLFRQVGWRQLGQMVLIAALTFAASLAAVLVVRAVGRIAGNPAMVALGAMPLGDFVIRLVLTIPQLVGEELLTILPFLAVLWLATKRLGLARRAGIAVALIGSTLIFSAAHLPTYDWHWAQCFGVIGAARVVLTLGFIWTRNLWASAGAHILNDWFEFLLVFGMNHRPIGVE